MFLNSKFSEMLQRYYLFFFLFFIIFIYGDTLNYPFQFDSKVDVGINPWLANLDFNGLFSDHPARITVFASFLINYMFGGATPFGFRVVNIMIHLFTALFVYRLTFFTLSELCKDKKIACYAVEVAFFVSLIFIVHPLQTSTVNYVVQRLTSFMSLCYIGGIYFYARGKNSKKKKDKCLYYLILVLFVILGFFSKEEFFTFPFALLLYDFYFLRSVKFVEWIREKRFFLLGIAFFFFLAVATVVFTRGAKIIFSTRLYDTGQYVSWRSYLFTQFGVILRYMGLFLFPYNQCADYYILAKERFFSLDVIFPIFVHLSIIIAAVLSYKKYKVFSFGIFWFYITLLIDSSIFPTLNLMNEYRVYAGLFGLSLSLVSVFYYSFSGKNRVYVLRVFLISLVILFSFLSVSRNRVWSGEEYFWKDILAKYPRKARCWSALGVYYCENGALDKGEACFEKALSILPDFTPAIYNLAKVYMEKGMYRESFDMFCVALKSRYAKVKLEKIYFHIAKLYVIAGHYEDALTYFTKAYNAGGNNDPELLRSMNEVRERLKNGGI